MASGAAGNTAGTPGMPGLVMLPGAEAGCDGRGASSRSRCAASRMDASKGVRVTGTNDCAPVKLSACRTQTC